MAPTTLIPSSVRSDERRFLQKKQIQVCNPSGKNRELNLVFLIFHKESGEIASINLFSSFRSMKAHLPGSKGTWKDSTTGDRLITLNTAPEENLRCTIFTSFSVMEGSLVAAAFWC